MERSLLIIDDDENVREVFSRFLAKSGFDVHKAATLSQAREAVARSFFEGALVDQLLPDGNGVELIAELRVANPDMAIVVVTGRGDIPAAVEAMRLGADNFLTKPVSLTDLELFLRKSMEIGRLRRITRGRRLLEKTKEPYFGTSEAMRSVVEHARLAAENEHAVLITGETGTGKGVLARWIHDNSARRTAAFVDVNCSGLRGELLASELFGHAKGSFTTAVRDREGLLDVADGGTLFLDEIGDMDGSVQAQFLKTIEEKSYRRLGEVRIRRSNFRLICATNKDLDQEAKAGRFRLDLYYRIQVMPVRIPALSQHLEDLTGLVRHILDSGSHGSVVIAPGVMELLQSYTWPGNIRELKNVLERASLLAQGGPIEPDHLPGLTTGVRKPSLATVGELQKHEEECIRAALAQSQGDVGQAARLLGISVATVYRKIKKYHLRAGR
jgi:DNA-binding NtrC family response regulator